MSTQRTINVPLETYDRLRAIHQRLLVMPVEKLTDHVRSLLTRGISLSSVTGLALDVLERELDRLDGDAVTVVVDAEIVTPSRKRKKGTTDDVY